ANQLGRMQENLGEIDDGDDQLGLPAPTHPEVQLCQRMVPALDPAIGKTGLGTRRNAADQIRHSPSLPPPSARLARRVQRKARSAPTPVPVLPQNTSTPVAGSISTNESSAPEAKSVPSVGRAASPS